LAEVASEIVMIHRRKSFRGAPDSVEKVEKLAEEGRIKLVTDAQVIGLGGKEKLEWVEIEQTGAENFNIETDHFIPLFGLSPKLGPIGEWGLQIDRSAVEVNTFDYSTNVPGVFAIGDINTYPGKLKLILCGFHEATLMVQSAFKIIHPEKKVQFKYTTVNGVEGF
jgi:thioredoxin reductase (NADPH)